MHFSARARALTHTEACTHACTCARAHTHTHTCTHARARAHTHTHTVSDEGMGRAVKNSLEIVVVLAV